MPLSSHALTTLAEAKTYLKLNVTDYDSTIERLINAASEAIEKYCNRHFEKAIYTEWYKGHGRQLLLLNQFPIVSVTSVTIDGSAYTEGEDNDFTIDSEAGMLFRAVGWPGNRYYGGLTQDPMARRRNIKVVYEAGYVLPKDVSPETPRTLPYDLEQACLLLVHFYYKRDIASFGTTFIENGAILRPDAWPRQVRFLLEPYRERRA